MAAARLSRDLVFEKESTEDFQTFDEHFMIYLFIYLFYFILFYFILFFFFFWYKFTLSEIVCFLSGCVTI